MSDRIDTPFDLSSTLAQIVQDLNVTPSASLAEIEAKLNPMLEDARARGDANAETLIFATHARVQEIIIESTTNRQLAAAAADLAATFQNQRNTIAGEYDELQEDLDNVNLKNPLVRYVHNEGMYDSSRTDEVESLYAETLYNRQLDNVTRLCGCDRDKARKFLTALWDEYTDVDIDTIELFTNIGNLINFAESF